jgi:hypothetical protein
MHLKVSVIMGNTRGLMAPAYLTGGGCGLYRSKDSQ